MKSATLLFAQSIDAWVGARKSELLTAAARHYPGDDATDAELVEAARSAWSGFSIDPPRPVPGRDGVTLEPADANELPPGVPGVAATSRRVVRVSLRVEGDAGLLAYRPVSGVLPGRRDWPRGVVAGGAAVVEMPDAPLKPEHVERLRADVARACELLARDLAILWQPGGFVLESFRQRQGDVRERRAADEKARRRLADLGYAVR